MSKRDELLSLAEDAIRSGRRDIAEQAISEAEALDKAAPAPQEQKPDRPFFAPFGQDSMGNAAVALGSEALALPHIAAKNLYGLAKGTPNKQLIQEGNQIAQNHYIEPKSDLEAAYRWPVEKAGQAIGATAKWLGNKAEGAMDYFGDEPQNSTEQMNRDIRKAYLGGGTEVLGQALLPLGAAKGIGAAAKSKVARDTANFERNEIERSQNSVKDESMRKAQELGLSFPPSSMGAGLSARMAEGLSGKAKTEQRSVIKNQPIIDSAARRDLGLADDVPLTAESTNAVAQKAYQTGYEPIKGIGSISTDPVYLAELDGILSRNQGGSSFPLVTRDEVGKIVTGYRANKFDSADAIDHIRMLREDANANFIKGENALARTQKDISKALENQVERHLEGQGAAGQAMLDQFRDSRKLIAKSKTVEKSIKDSSVDAQKLAAMLRSGKPLEGDMRTIAEMANSKMTSGSMRMPQAGDANPFTYLDFVGGAGLGAAVNPALMALPVARLGAREAILSRPAQKAMSKKTYNNQTANELNNRNIRLLNNSEQAKRLAKALMLQQTTQEEQ